eukprot:TRINITY_DN701_c0_g1_i1.p1 TRINITY_DN701_c0_g1~~TRINITY_DN701_c0_g1_i1.p1  ORF type:complete len:277 (-),score=39.98 TRINITY_DN701_c0_g1_i1:862-1692(-)
MPDMKIPELNDCGISEDSCFYPNLNWGGFKGVFCNPDAAPCCGEPPDLDEGCYCFFCWTFGFLCSMSKLIAYTKGTKTCGICCDCCLPFTYCCVCGLSTPVMLFILWCFFGFFVVCFLIILLILFIIVTYLFWLVIAIISIWVPIIGIFAECIELAAVLILSLLEVIAIILVILFYIIGALIVISAICFAPCWPLTCLTRHNVRVMNGVGKDNQWLGDCVLSYLMVLCFCSCAQTLRHVPVEAWDLCHKDSDCTPCGDCGWILYDGYTIKDDVYAV